MFKDDRYTHFNIDDSLYAVKNEYILKECIKHFCSVIQQPNLGPGRISGEVSISHTMRDTHTHTHGRAPVNE